MELSIKIENAKELLAAFRRAPAMAQREYMLALERIAAKVQGDAMRNAPVGKNYSGGGNLRQSIKMGRYGNTGFIVFVNATYGIYVDQGTRPHVILPKNKPFLAFQKDGQWIFTKRVNHPGTKPQPFFTNAVKYNETYANQQMSNALDRVLANI